MGKFGICNEQRSFFKSPYEIELTHSPLPVPGEEEVLIKSQISGISAGTELLVYRGQFPPKMSVDAAIPSLTRPFSYPLAYGYASVGKVVEIGRSVKKELLGRSVFCFHPHESHYVVQQDQLVQLPDDVDPVNGVFLATMETAVNFLMDGRPVIGENIVIFGQGIVGLLTALLLSRLPLGNLVALDPKSLRRAKAKIAGVKLVLDPESPDAFEGGSNLLKAVADGGGADLVFELSGNPAALNQAIAIAAPGARIVIGSWYGSKKAELDLGGEFHRSRIQLISSQVSTLAPQFSDRWTKPRRMKVALGMIRQLNPARFVTHRYPVQRAAEAYELLDQRSQEALQVVLTYDEDC